MKERQYGFEVLIVVSEVLRKRVHYFSLCRTRTDSASTWGCIDIPFPLLKFNICSSWFMNLPTSPCCSQFPFDNRSLANLFIHFPSFFNQVQQSLYGNPSFNPVHACMINVWPCNLYDELALRGVTYGHNSCMMKQEFWFLPKLYNENFLSDDHCVTHKKGLPWCK